MNKYELKFFTAQSGAHSALLQKNDGTIVHLHSLVNPEAESEFFDEFDLWGDRIIFLGTGLGYHLNKLLAKAPQNSKFLFIDYFEELVSLCAEKFNWLSFDTISSKTSNLEAKIEDFLSGGNMIQFVKHPPSYSPNRPFYDQIVSLFPVKKASTLKSGNILLLYGNFFLQEEICNAIVKEGFEPVLFDYRKINGTQQYQSELQFLIQKFKPEIILSINMLGFDGNGVLSDIAEKYGIPVGVWFVDDPAPILLHQQHFITSSMFAFCWERYYIPGLKKMKFQKVEYLPLATDPGIFPLKPQSERYADVGFVGSSMGMAFLQTISSKFMWHDSLLPVIGQCADILYREPERAVESILEEVTHRMKVVLPFSDLRNRTWLYSYIIHTASMKKRKDIICALSDFNINTFGDSTGWEILCGKSLKRWPDIDYRTELARYYRGIDVNVNITSCQMKTAVNQRVFDVPVCGGFIITDYQEDLNHLFSENELVVYKSIEELREKVAYFKVHGSARAGISEKAREKILNEHTYYHRFKTIYKYMLGTADFTPLY